MADAANNAASGGPIQTASAGTNVENANPHPWLYKQSTDDPMLRWSANMPTHAKDYPGTSIKPVSNKRTPK